MSSNLEYFPSFLTLKSYIKDKKITPSKITVNIGHQYSFINSWRENIEQSGGGTLIDNGIHALCYLYEIDDLLKFKKSKITKEAECVEQDASVWLSSRNIKDILVNATWSKNVGYANVEVFTDDLKITASAFDAYITIYQNGDEFKIYSRDNTNSIISETEAICNELIESKKKRVTNIDKVKVVQTIIDQAYSKSLEKI